MRLLTKNTLILLIITVIVFLLGGFVFYFQLKNIMNEEANESLYLKKNEIISYINKHQQLPDTLLSEDLMSFKPVNSAVNERMLEELLYIKSADEKLPFKKLVFTIKLKNQHYECHISKSLFEDDDLIETIIFSFFTITLFLIGVFIAANYFFSKNNWKPFFTLLDKIKGYEIEKHKVIHSENSKILEFKQLNDAITVMTTKIATDFNNLKTFTENASHELQTPLAIIKNKSELLLQTEGLTETLAKQIIDIHQAATRLSKLNQTLLLLSKIENNQFQSTESVNFHEIIKNKLKQFEDLIEMKKLSITDHLNPNIRITIHPVLADIMVSNILSNAIRYSPISKNITITLTENYFSVSNEGAALKANAEDLFTRFYKENPSSESTGLGLALVKQIATLNNHTIKYEYLNNIHIFEYCFSNYRIASN